MHTERGRQKSEVAASTGAVRTTGSSAPVDAPAGAATHPDRLSVLEFSERERSRIGFDLHDGPAQVLSAALLQLKLLDGAEGDVLRDGMAELRSMIGLALDETYELIEQLQNGTLGDWTLRERLSSYVDDFAGRSGLEVRFTATGEDIDMTPSLRIAIFRIVQEALTNARRHAHADRVDVTLQRGPDIVCCTIVDDGCGFDAGVAASDGGSRRSYGLSSMRERARLLDGECTIHSAPGAGTRIEVRIPVWRG